MKYLITAITCSFLCACGDKDSDTSADTASTEDSVSVE